MSQRGATSILKLLEVIDPGTLNGAIIACPAMNPAAFEIGARGNPADTHAFDMNRIYPGRIGGYPTERAAAAHFAAMTATCDLRPANQHPLGRGRHVHQQGPLRP